MIAFVAASLLAIQATPQFQFAKQRAEFNAMIRKMSQMPDGEMKAKLRVEFSAKIRKISQMTADDYRHLMIRPIEVRPVPMPIENIK
jgi:hypothetical protein